MSEADKQVIKDKIVKFLKDIEIEEVLIYESVVFLPEQDISVSLENLPEVRVIVSPTEKYEGNVEEVITLLKALLNKKIVQWSVDLKWNLHY